MWLLSNYGEPESVENFPSLVWIYSMSCKIRYHDSICMCDHFSSMSLCLSPSAPPAACLYVPAWLHQYRVFHFKKLVKRLIIILKWMKHRQPKPAAPEIPFHKRLPFLKRSSTLDFSTQRHPRVPLSVMKKSSSLDNPSRHLKPAASCLTARYSMFRCSTLVCRESTAGWVVAHSMQCRICVF